MHVKHLFHFDCYYFKCCLSLCSSVHGVCAPPSGLHRPPNLDAKGV